MSYGERRKTGTTLIGLLYNKGSLLLSDSQMTAGVRGEPGALKIFPIENNIILAFCGHLALGQKILNSFREQIREYRDAMEENLLNEYKTKLTRHTKERRKKAIKTFRKLSKEEQAAKLMQKDFMLVDTKDGIETKEIPRDLDGNIEYQTSSIAYHVSGKQVLAEINTTTEFLRQTMETEQQSRKKEEDEDIDFLLAGYDAEGPKLYEVAFDQSINPAVNGYMTAGSGSRAVRPRLKDLYSPEMPLEKAMQIAIYAGLKASQEDIMTNDIFRIGITEESHGRIRTRIIEQNLVNRITEEMKKTKLRFPFKKF